jgi:hypothetical protein
MMKAHFSRMYRRCEERVWRQSPNTALFLMVRAVILCGLLFLLSGCAKVPARSGSVQDVSTQLPRVQTSVVSPTPTPKPVVITLQVTGCPPGLTLNWDMLVGTKASVNKVQTVSCGSLEGSGSLDALIGVRYYTADARLDSYVYGDLFATPHRLFAMGGLLNGDVQISPAGTIMTAESGSGDPVLGQRDVFKEYSWSGTAFQQILFPGIYPDMTYYQAELDQSRLNAELAAGDKRDAWKATFSGVANQLAKQIFHWTSTRFSTIQFSNHNGSYIGSVTNLGPGGGGFVASMFHLDNNASNIFVIKQVSSLDGGTALTSPTMGLQLNSPTSISGSALAAGGVLGRVVIYSDTFIAFGDSGDIPSPGSGGYVNFSRSVTYRLNSAGTQEGLVAFYATTQNDAFLSNQVVMVKVFLAA